MSEPQFGEVVAAWDVADVNDIHPLRRKDEPGYWESGKTQAAHAGSYAPPGGTVMDFGCGEGRLTLPLARAGFTVLAVDASPTMLKRLIMNLGEVGSDAEASVHMIRSNGLNLNARYVDVIVARAVLIHHTHDDVARLVSALTKCLKPGGTFIADWPTGGHYVRQTWTDVTTWEPEHRLQVGKEAGLELVEDATPTVWKKV